MNEQRIPQVYAAIAAVMGDLAKQGISKDETNAFDKYKFRGIDAVYNALAPLLSKHGLLILPRVLERNSEERTAKSGGVVYYVALAVEYDFVCAKDASMHTIRAYGEAMDRGDKGTNKAMTAAYKYACFETFCIPTEGDDADRETHEVVKAVKPPCPDEKFTENLARAKPLIESGAKTAEALIAAFVTRYTLTDEQAKAIAAIKPIKETTDANDTAKPGL